MSSLEVILLLGASLLLMWVMVTVMVRANRSQRLRIERRRAEWRATGAIPEDEPNFECCGGGGS